MANVQIYTTDYCHYCRVAKSLLDEQGIPYEEINISKTPEMRDVLVEKTGEWTVPQIFVNGEYIGQDDELREWLTSGRLK
ncbi:MAG: glutathione S-transferase N-terminal domain-containing protein [Nitrospirae bacterium]|nr:glutathione S-transferase N-terminal domain-containing protein [Nitrospirota bacterium]